MTQTPSHLVVNWPVYNHMSGRLSHSSETENITLVGLHLTVFP